MWFDYVNSVGVITALALSAYQTRRLATDARRRDQDRRTERALDLYRDVVVEGDTAKALENVSVTLRKEGGRRFGVTTWYRMGDDALDPGGLMDPAAPGAGTAYQDFYRVLWFYERVESALNFKLVDPDMLFHSVGFHCWWWGQLLVNVHGPKASDALHRLAPQAADWARRHDQYDTWVQRCATDFDAGAPVEL